MFRIKMATIVMAVITIQQHTQLVQHRILTIFLDLKSIPLIKAEQPRKLLWNYQLIRRQMALEEE